MAIEKMMKNDELPGSLMENTLVMKVVPQFGIAFSWCKQLPFHYDLLQT